MFLPTYVSKNLIAASSTGVGSFSSAGTVTLNTSSLGTGRRIIIWGSTSVGATIVISGLSESGTPISETIVGSTSGAAIASNQDYLSLTSVSLSSGVTSTQGYIGTNTQGGTPWQSFDLTRHPPNLGFGIILSSTANSVAASLEYTLNTPSYNNQTKLWNDPSVATTGPLPTISSMGSTVSAALTVGNINFPIQAWRITVTSTSSGAGTVYGTAIQTG